MNRMNFRHAEGFLGHFTDTEVPCPYCEAKGILTHGFVTPTLKRAGDGALHCVGSHYGLPQVGNEYAYHSSRGYTDRGRDGVFRYSLRVRVTRAGFRGVEWECVGVLREEGRPGFDRSPLLGMTGGVALHAAGSALRPLPPTQPAPDGGTTVATKATGNEAFRRDMIRWLQSQDPDGDFSDEATAAQGMQPITVAQGIDIATMWARDEVLADMDTGTVPASVRSFSTLHDHVDANGYGGAFDWPEHSELSEAYQDAFLGFWNRVQDNVDRWLKAGRPDHKGQPIVVVVEENPWNEVLAANPVLSAQALEDAVKKWAALLRAGEAAGLEGSELAEYIRRGMTKGR
jgi:hypothetical protein